MTDPEDGWGDLARELGLDPLPRHTSPPTTDAQANTADEDADTPFPADDSQPDLFQEYEPESESDETELGSDLESDSDDGTDAGADAGSGEGPGEPGEDGQKRKRRRRRRRKKKGGEPGESVAGEAVTVGEGDDGEDGEEEAGEADETDAPVPVDDGSPSAEASRELIANWDVPSWEQIVAGLYRPGGR